MNRWVDDPFYVDGKRKELIKFGLDIRDPISGRNLEIDRFYYTAKVAIEIQGQQHYYPAKRFAKHLNPSVTLEKRKQSDTLKKAIIIANGIEFIEIKYDDPESVILGKLLGKLTLRQVPLGVDECDMAGLNGGIDRYSSIEAVKKALMEIKEKHAGEKLSSTLIREENNLLYTAIKHFHGGVRAIRELIDEPHIRREKGYWTLPRVVSMLLELRNTLQRWPVRSEMHSFHGSLVYAIKRHGGYIAIKSLIVTNGYKL